MNVFHFGDGILPMVILQLPDAALSDDLAEVEILMVADSNGRHLCNYTASRK